MMNKGVVYALWGYEAQNSDELSFHEGDAITVLRRKDESETEWWWARLGDREGYVPRNLLGVSTVRSLPWGRPGQPGGPVPFFPSGVPCGGRSYGERWPFATLSVICVSGRVCSGGRRLWLVGTPHRGGHGGRYRGATRRQSSLTQELWRAAPPPAPPQLSAVLTRLWVGASLGGERAGCSVRGAENCPSPRDRAGAPALSPHA